MNGLGTLYRRKVADSVDVARVRVKMTTDNVAGVRLPVFEEVEVSSEPLEAMGLAGGGKQIERSRQRWQVLLSNLIRLASLQVRGRACGRTAPLPR